MLLYRLVRHKTVSFKKMVDNIDQPPLPPLAQIRMTQWSSLGLLRCWISFLPGALGRLEGGSPGLCAVRSGQRLRPPAPHLLWHHLPSCHATNWPSTSHTRSVSAVGSCSGLNCKLGFSCKSLGHSSYACLLTRL